MPNVTKPKTKSAAPKKAAVFFTTDIALRQAKPGAVLLDALSPGLRFVVSERTRSFIYRYQVPSSGKAAQGLRQIKLGNYPSMSLSDARAAWQKERDRKAIGLDPRAERKVDARREAEAQRQQERDAYTVGSMIDDYVDERVAKARSEKSTAEVRRLLTKELDKNPDTGRASFLDRPAQTITRSEMHELFVNEIGERAESVARVGKRELEAAFIHAIDAGRLPANFTPPTLTVARRMFPQGRRERVLKDAEIAALLKFMPEHYSRTVADALRLTLLTAARSGEVTMLEWDWIDLKQGQIVIPKAMTKSRRRANAADYSIMLPTQAVALLRERKGSKNERRHARYVFATSREHGADRAITQKALGVEVWTNREHQPKGLVDYVPHDLRRTAATGLAALGAPPAVVEAILNHAMPGVAGIYNRYTYDKERREWIQRWADHLDALVATK